MHDSTSYIGVGLGSELDPLELRHISFVSCYETHSNPNWFSFNRTRLVGIVTNILFVLLWDMCHNLNGSSFNWNSTHCYGIHIPISTDLVSIEIGPVGIVTCIHFVLLRDMCPISTDLVSTKTRTIGIETCILRILLWGHILQSQQVYFQLKLDLLGLWLVFLWNMFQSQQVNWYSTRWNSDMYFLCLVMRLIF
jgi:hypothetical protein